MIKHLIFFDASCPLCQRSIQKIIHLDSQSLFLFTPLDGKTASIEFQKKLVHLKQQNTLVLFENYKTQKQRLWVRGRAVFRIFWLLGGAWKLIGWICFVPIGVNILYRLFASLRHRLKLSKPCISIPKHRDRFLP
jgi:predicted DCC family thiol-disulfide oxidoreductase YuxK